MYFMSTAFGRPEGGAEEVNLMWTQVYVGAQRPDSLVVVING